MPITLLDIILIGVMLVSGLLAMIRGFMREILSITAWVIAAVVTLYFYAKLLPFAKSYFNNDIVASQEASDSQNRELQSREPQNRRDNQKQKAGMA